MARININKADRAPKVEMLPEDLGAKTETKKDKAPQGPINRILKFIKSIIRL